MNLESSIVKRSFSPRYSFDNFIAAEFVPRVLSTTANANLNLN